MVISLLENTQQNGMYVELDHLVLRDRLEVGFQQWCLSSDFD